MNKILILTLFIFLNNSLYYSQSFYGFEKDKLVIAGIQFGGSSDFSSDNISLSFNKILYSARMKFQDLNPDDRGMIAYNGKYSAPGVIFSFHQDPKQFALINTYQTKNTIPYNMLAYPAEPEDTQKNSGIGNNIFYFIGGAAVAAIIYLVWNKTEENTNSTLTFGKPPVPVN